MNVNKPNDIVCASDDERQAYGLCGFVRYQRIH